MAPDSKPAENMLFYTFDFIYGFLPMAVLGYFLAAKLTGPIGAVIFLVAASLAFYAQWSTGFVGLLCASISANYFVGVFLQKKRSLTLLVLSLFLNLALLGYFKYANFFIETIDNVIHAGWHAADIVLPLGISFYTFQQIAWLVDSYSKKITASDGGFWRYALFVLFFPQLIAGPIVHHSEMMPQFSKKSSFRINWRSVAVGLSIFIIGMVKKVVIADNMAAFSTPVFTDAEAGIVPAGDAWLAAFCFTLQIYFDFSGYSDMAIGLARIFNIRLPMNFNSPLRAQSMADLWKRWHLTMTRFFQDYLYTPLSLYFLRKQIQLRIRGNTPIYCTTFVTFVAIGFWHGANWTFIAFGAIHGGYLIANHLWKNFRKQRNLSPFPAPANITLTFFFFMLSCVVYRAESMTGAMRVFQSMIDIDSVLWGGAQLERLSRPWSVPLILTAATVAFSFPNTQQIMQKYMPVINMADYDKISKQGPWSRILWRPSSVWFLILALFFSLSFYSVYLEDVVHEFIYFQF